MSYREEEQSMNYKKIIRKNGTCSRRTKEYIIFSDENDKNKKHIKVQFDFDWSYEEEDGFEYTELSNFSGHGKYKEDTRKFLEDYCKKYFPDLHHMSY